MKTYPRIPRRRFRRFKWNWSVGIYLPVFDTTLERALMKTARQHKGHLGGSGSLLCGGMQRDISFVFLERDEADKFAARVKAGYRAKVKLRPRAISA